MKKLLMSSVMSLFCLSGLTGCVGCTTVRPGNVGIIVPLYGSKEDKTEYQTVYGRVWYNSWYNDVYVFPTFMQQVVWDKEGPRDESVTFNSTEGKGINCDVAFAYSIKAESVPHIFRDQRKSIEEITDGYLRSRVRDALNRHASTITVGEILGAGKEQLLQAAKKDLVTELEPKGYVIDMLSIVGEMRVDEGVRASISRTIQALQDAISAQNKVKQSEAEARQKVAEAEGKAKSILAIAEGEAKARLVNAESQAKSNELLKKSISREVLEYTALKAWDGKLPLFSGGQATPFVNVSELITPAKVKGE